MATVSGSEVKSAYPAVVLAVVSSVGAGDVCAIWVVISRGVCGMVTATHTAWAILERKKTMLGTGMEISLGENACFLP